MATQAQIKRERIKFLKSLKPLARKADGSLEKMEREIVRLTKRKRATPEEKDLNRLNDFLMAIVKDLQAFEKELQKGFIE